MNKEGQRVDDKADFVFGPFRFDLARDCLWRAQEVVRLRAKPLAVLRYLLEHPGQVVTTGELLKYVWAGVYVTKTALRVCLREIRLALEDEATAPRYIETVGRQGYRFIGQVRVLGRRESSLGGSPPVTAASWPAELYFIGREKELAYLRRGLAFALAGRQQLIFVTGEAGIGKTALVNTFLHHAQETSQPWIAHGQCVEQYGAGAPYLPLLGALRRLCQETGVEQFVRVFTQHAPVWLTQLPTLLSQEQRIILSPSMGGAPRERMLQELVEGLAALSAVRPLILVLEDLHWSDSATVAALAYLARSRDPTRLLVLGTYRQASLVIEEHPLRGLVQELLAHKLCEKMQLELLSEAEVEEYLEQQLGGNPLAAELRPLVFQRTDGNALFVVNLVDYLLRQGLIQQEEDQRLTPELVTTIETELPEGLQQLILKEVEGMSGEAQQVLEAASMAGLHFTAAEVAAAEKKEAEYIEAVCDGLVQQQRLIAADGSEAWPDGTITTGYRFVHALYQQVVSRRVGLARQVRLHRLISERLETAYGARAAEIASHLAVHFEQGRDHRAVHYRCLAAEQALRQSAYQEAELHSRAGVALLATLPDTPEHKQWELRLRQHGNVALSATRGFMDEELEANLQRTAELCRELEDDTAFVPILVGLSRMQMVRANRVAVAELEQQAERTIERLSDTQLRVQLHTPLANFAILSGRHTRAAEQYQHVLACNDPQAQQSFLLSFGGDPLIVASFWSGLSLCLAGQPEQGWSRIAQALARAEEASQPFVLVDGLVSAAMVKLLCGEYDEAWRLAQKMDALTRKHHFSLYKIVAGMLQGSITVRRGVVAEGMADITNGISQYHAIGAQLRLPFFLSFLAEGYRQQGKLDEALQIVSEALSLTATNLDVFWEAELHRLKGELTLAQSSVQRLASRVQKNQRSKGKGQKAKVFKPQAPSPKPQAEAEVYLRRAVEIARQQGAKLLELRAATSLAHLWQQQGKRPEARNTLANIYNWFTEGFDTADLQTARTLLAEWSAASQSAARPSKPEG